MAAFLIVEIKGVRDQATYARYRESVVPETLADGGGEYLLRGGRVEVPEGGWGPGRVAVVRFASAAARDWWSGPQYAELSASGARIQT